MDFRDRRINLMLVVSCVYRKLNPDVVVMKSAQDGV